MPSHDRIDHSGHQPITLPVVPGSVVHDVPDNDGHGIVEPNTTHAPGLDPVAPHHEDGAKTSAKISTRPGRPVPKAQFQLDVHLKDAGGKAFDPVLAHERPIHLLVISDDLVDFQHLHPERERKGHYTLELSVPRARTYKAFAEYTAPGADGSSTAVSTIGTSGTKAPAASLALDLHDKTIGRTRVSIQGATHLRAGQDSTFTISVEDLKGLPVDDLRPWLGAPAHGVIVDEKLSGLVHAHAMAGRDHAGAQHASGDVPPTFMFHARFEHQGFHKIWIQFDRGGEVITAPFVVDVR